MLPKSLKEAREIASHIWWACDVRLHDRICELTASGFPQVELSVLDDEATKFKVSKIEEYGLYFPSQKIKVGEEIDINRLKELLNICLELSNAPFKAVGIVPHRKQPKFEESGF